MDTQFRSRHQYSPYVPATSEHPINPSWPYAQGRMSAHLDDQDTTYVPRKPVQSAVDTIAVGFTEDIGSTSDIEREPVKRRIYWLLPLATIALFIIGLAAAVGHFVYFNTLNGKPVENQQWTQRYSLAIAFVFKSALAASISLALAQRAWLLLRRNKNGTLIPTIDAMLFAQSSLLKILSPSLWISAFSIALMAACIWVMPLTAVVAPTALTVVTSSTTTDNQNCVVPTLQMDFNRVFTQKSTERALFVADHTGHYLEPSISSYRITDSVLETGRQISWHSPCGPDCTYLVQFKGPSWQCTLVDNIDDPRAPWKYEYGGSYWYQGVYGDGSNITMTNKTVLDETTAGFIYGPVYHAGLNASTNQFWAGFAAGYEQGFDFADNLVGKTLRDVLDVQVYACQIANTSYALEVNYTHGNQINTILQAQPFSTFDISAGTWNTLIDDSPSNPQDVSIDLQEIAAMYTPMLKMLSGTIQRDPRNFLITNTSLGLVSSLVEYLPSYVTYGSQTPYLPLENLGSLLESLSQNLTISLLSDSTLGVVTNTTVACQQTQYSIVWKFHTVPLVAAYAAGLGVTLICLCIGTHALIVNRVAHEISFSAVLRTTRNEGLNKLCDSGDIGALPLPKKIEKQKLGFNNTDPFDTVGDGKSTGFRTGFVLKN